MQRALLLSRGDAADQRGALQASEPAQPTKLGKQVNVLFQGASLLSHVSGDSSSFASAKAAVLPLLERAAAQSRFGAQQLL